MMYSKLLEIINQITDIDEKETELIKNSFNQLRLAKGEFFLEAGKINKHIGFPRFATPPRSYHHCITVCCHRNTKVYHGRCDPEFCVLGQWTRSRQGTELD